MALVTTYLPIYTSHAPQLCLLAEEAVDDSDKTITVPSGEIWRILWIHIELTSTSDAGNRYIAVEYRDAADDVIFNENAGLVQAASLTYNYSFFPGANVDTTVHNSQANAPLPINSVLPAGYDIRIRDGAAIAAAADDMVIQMMVQLEH